MTSWSSGKKKNFTSGNLRTANSFLLHLAELLLMSKVSSIHILKLSRCLYPNKMERDHFFVQFFYKLMINVMLSCIKVTSVSLVLFFLNWSSLGLGCCVSNKFACVPRQQWTKSPLCPTHEGYEWRIRILRYRNNPIPSGAETSLIQSFPPWICLLRLVQSAVSRYGTWFVTSALCPHGCFHSRDY